MGKRLAAEVLLLEKPLTAKEALGCGFINGIIPELQGEDDFFDIAKVPAIGKLLSQDYRTLTNCKFLMNYAKNNEKITDVMAKELQHLVDSY